MPQNTRKFNVNRFVLLGFRTKLKLNQSQRREMAQHAGYHRWVYNWGLATKIQLYEDGIKIKTTQLKKFYTNHVKPEYPWQSQLSSRVYQYAFRDLDNAYNRFFKQCRISNLRRDYLHKMTSYIAKTWSTVAIEDLCVHGMLANRKLSKAIADQAFYEFRRQLEYKCSLYGSKLVLVDRFYPSSKTCSNCQHLKQDLTLKDRWFTCDDCGEFLPRDLNASVNLARYADGLSVKACGVDNADVTTFEAGSKK